MPTAQYIIIAALTIFYLWCTHTICFLHLRNSILQTLKHKIDALDVMFLIRSTAK